MRIELNAGGLDGIVAISGLHADFSGLISRSRKMMSTFRLVRQLSYGMSGGVGSLQGAVNEIESRISAEENRITSIETVEKKTNSFLELAIKTDIQASIQVNRSKNEFYRVNPWAKPPQTDNTEKSFREKAWEWLCGIGDNIKETAKKAWDGIKSFCSAVKEKISEIGKMIHDLVFPKRSLFDSKKGCYGGDQMVFQSASAAERKKYKEIFEKNNPGVNYTDKQFKNYMKKLTSEGCGYVALVNTIFQQYEGREEEFEATFGYPMYKSNGKLNYEMLTVDLYSRMDNRDVNGNLDIDMDYNGNPSSQKYDGPHNTYNYKNDSTGIGTTTEQWTYYLPQFMKEHGVNAKVERNVTVTAQNYNQIVASGKQVIVAFYRGDLYNMDGTVKQHISGGHAMTVTGTTPDGKIIVSSWGNKYYIDPSKNSDNGQWMSFATVEYE